MNKLPENEEVNVIKNVFTFDLKRSYSENFTFNDCPTFQNKRVRSSDAYECETPR